MARVVLDSIYKTFPQQSRDRSATLSPSESVAEAAAASAVLRRINLTVEDGEFMVLVGPSGCGKSTLLRMIAGLETITAGTISVGDQVVNDLPPKQRDVAMVFQSYALYPHLTVYDNLAFGLRRMRQYQNLSPSTGESPWKSGSEMDTTVDVPASQPLTPTLGISVQLWGQELLVAGTRRLPKGLRYLSAAERMIDEQVRGVARMLQIEPLLHRYPRQLSGGQKQRVALGRAMARNPQVFLMDEPLSNLDAKLRTETRAQIVNLQRQLGITTIYVTHDQVEAMTMGDRIAVMNQGQIQQLAPPLDLYRYPANRFVASFIGSPMMNFLPVQVKSPLVISHRDFRLTLPGAWEEILTPYDGKMVICGIRPEHLSISLPAPKNLPVRVLRVEALGSDTYLTVQMDDLTLQVRVEPDRTVRIGEELWLAIASDNIHLFDANTEQSLYSYPSA